MERYFKHRIENLINVNKIITLHFFEFDKDYSFKGEFHDFWEIVFCVKNGIYCTTNGKKVYLKSGEAIFHKPNVFHSLFADGENPSNVIIISFDSKSSAMRFFENKVFLLSEFEQKLFFDIMEEGKKTFDIPFSDPEIKKMNLLSEPTLGGRQLIKNYLEVLLINVIRNRTETENGNNIFLSERELDNRMVKSVIEFLSQNVYNKISIDDVIKQINYSRALMFREFKKETRKSVIEYYNILKINKAKELLLKEKKTVKEVAEILCFDTPNYFSKVFKKTEGVSPKQYVLSKNKKR